MLVVRIVSELDFGGVEQVLAYSVPALKREAGSDLTILVLGRGGKIADQLINQGISVQILGSNPRIPNISLILSLSKILSRMRPDVVHTQGSEANFHGILGAKLTGVKRIIGEEIGIPNHHSYWKLIFRYVYKQTHQVIAISKAVKKEIVELGEVKKEKVKVLYNPVLNRQLTVDRRLRSVSPVELLTNKFVFVTTCRLVPIKNLDRLIQSFAGLVERNPDRELFLKIVGEGPERENLERISRELGIGNRIKFEGYQRDVFLLLLEADAFILPSLREGSSVSLAEAMTAGLPSIVTNVGGAAEILGDSQSGFSINPLDVNSIQTAMQKLIDLGPEQRQAMSDRAKKEAQRFSVETYIQNLLSIYHGY